MTMKTSESENRQSKKKWANRLGGLGAILTSSGLGFISFAACVLIFPNVSILLPIYAFIAGGSVEGQIYWRNTRKAFKDFMVSGLEGHTRHFLVKKKLKAGIAKLLTKEQVAHNPALVDKLYYWFIKRATELLKKEFNGRQLAKVEVKELLFSGMKGETFTSNKDLLELFDRILGG